MMCAASSATGRQSFPGVPAEGKDRRGKGQTEDGQQQNGQQSLQCID
jgi:hypothetical protein